MRCRAEESNKTRNTNTKKQRKRWASTSYELASIQGAVICGRMGPVVTAFGIDPSSCGSKKQDGTVLWRTDAASVHVGGTKGKTKRQTGSRALIIKSEEGGEWQK